MDKVQLLVLDVQTVSKRFELIALALDLDLKG